MINGILNIYKEKGYTSHDVVARLRGIAGQKKIGHTGTLDPEAEGVLPVCLGRATKVCDMLTDKDKTYEAVLLLGRVTDTQDTTGKVLSERPVNDPDLPGGPVTEQKAEECIRGFIGTYDQIPPMYSALKVGGKKLYELAREGKTVERRSRKVLIHDIRVKEVFLPRVRMEVDCSKGTYIRTLCHDIGEKLGVGGCMESLLRTRVGRFRLEESLRLADVEDHAKNGNLSQILLPLDSVFPELRQVVLKDGAVSLGYNGNPFCLKHVVRQPGGAEPAGAPEQKSCAAGPADGERFSVYDSRERFIGIYRYEGKRGQFRLEKMFLDPDGLSAGKTEKKDR